MHVVKCSQFLLNVHCECSLTGLHNLNFHDLSVFPCLHCLSNQNGCDHNVTFRQRKHTGTKTPMHVTKHTHTYTHTPEMVVTIIQHSKMEKHTHTPGMSVNCCFPLGKYEHSKPLVSWLFRSFGRIVDNSLIMPGCIGKVQEVYEINIKCGWVGACVRVHPCT